MKNRLKSFRMILQVVGGFTLFLILGVSFVFLYERYQNHERTEPFSNKDVRFVLNHGGLSTEQDYSVLSSYQGLMPINGDHLEYHCLQLTEFNVNPDYHKDWTHGPEANPILAKVFEESANYGKIQECFAGGAATNFDALEKYIWSVHLRNRDTIEGAQVLFFNPESKRLLYVSFEN